MFQKKIKKVGILTQPLLNNYGGLLQAYALQTVLKKRGYDVWIINRNYPKPRIKNILKSRLKRFIVKNILSSTSIAVNPSDEEEKIIGQHTHNFKKKFIHPITKELISNEEMDYVNTLGFDAYLVGSDQVWRPHYSPSITNYFLDFAIDDANIKRISYAASFGVDNWEFNQKETLACNKLVQKFNAVSVRETSGINLCKEYLEKMAIQVLDPTMLLDPKDYITLTKEEGEPRSEGNLMTYVLDKTAKKERFINDIAEKLNLTTFTVMQRQKLTGSAKIDDCIFPRVTKWLRGFMDAKFVITDSFHGCAFAILFNKPFLALGNNRRGITRFNSLLEMFDLGNRLILDDFTFDNSLIENDIDWNKVNSILKKERDKSLIFLTNSLN